jgi:hypothetical protein
MSRRDERAAGYLLLLLMYVIYTIAMYIYDQFKTAYYFILDFYTQNSDAIFLLIIAIVAACYWYLCGWLGSKKKNKLETTRLEPTAKPEVKPEPFSNLENEYIPEIEPASKLGHESDEAISEVEDATSQRSIYNAAEAMRSAPKIEPSPKEVADTVSEDELQALNPTTIPPTSPESEPLSKPKYDIITDKNSALVIWHQLRMEGIDVLPLQIEDRLKLATEMLHMPMDEAKRKTLNYFRRYGQPEAKYEAQTTDFYMSPTWIALARQIRKRDNFTCRRCGKYGPNGGGELHVHHIIPRGRGGPNEPSNLITLCSDCHSMQPHHRRLRNS